MSARARAELLREAWSWLGRHEREPEVMDLIRHYQRWQGILATGHAAWCLIWAMHLIRTQRPQRPWHGSVSQLRGWITRGRPGELVAVADVLPGDLVCWERVEALDGGSELRLGHCGIAVAEGAAITLEGNAGDQVSLVTDADAYATGWAWRWWGD